LLKDLEKNGDDLFSGIAIRDRGYHEFLRGEISKGKELLESSLKILEKFPGEKAISFKYLACVLMKEKNWKESFNCFFIFHHTVKTFCNFQLYLHPFFRRRVYKMRRFYNILESIFKVANL